MYPDHVKVDVSTVYLEDFISKFSCQLGFNVQISERLHEEQTGSGVCHLLHLALYDM